MSEKKYKKNHKKGDKVSTTPFITQYTINYSTFCIAQYSFVLQLSGEYGGAKGKVVSNV